MNKNKAFTLTELVIGLMIGVFILLAVGAISQVGPESYEKLRGESQVYNDIMYGFDLIKSKVHSAKVVGLENWHRAEWPEDMLVLDDSAFGIYVPKKSTERQFVYLKDKDNINTEEDQDKILIGADINTLAFTLDQTQRNITVRITGNKGKVGFDLTTAASKRN